MNTKPKGVAAMVNVIGKSGEPLAPTNRYGKIRHLLKDGMAVVVSKNPFTVQLTYQTTPFSSTLPAEKALN